MADGIDVRSEQIQVWVGFNGEHFRTERDAMESIILDKIATLIEDACGHDGDPNEGARQIMKRRADVLRWLQLVTDK